MVGTESRPVVEGVGAGESHVFGEMQMVMRGEKIPADVHESAALTDYAVAARYPGPSEPVLVEDFEKAVGVARAVLAWVAGIVEVSSQA